MSREAAHHAGPPPAAFWLLPAALAALRAVPFLATWFFEAPEGHAYLHVGYLPKDLLQYEAFMRMTAEHGAWFWSDPFTTAPQGARFFMPFLGVLGWLAGVLGLAPGLVFELSRIPLVFALFALLWRFLSSWLPDARVRLHACLLIALSGGIDAFVRPIASALPAGMAHQLQQSTWPLYGWNTFELAYNPLWLAGMIGVLVILRPALAPQGVQRAREGATITLGLVALHLVHPYSSIAVLTAIAGAAVLDWIQRGALDRRRWLSVLVPLLPALVVLAAFARWQAGDPVYRVASANVLGAQLASPFWYPLTYGALFVLALQGAQHWSRSQHPQARALLGWAGAIALLHSSPVLNGYHFVAFLHIPVSIAAAPALGAWLARARGAATGGARAAACLGLTLLFVDPLANTAEAVRDAQRGHFVPRAYLEAIETLQSLPPGNVLSPPALGNLIPAFSDHRVWVGHHFLTPDYLEKRAAYARLVAEPGHAAELAALIERERIDTVIVPDAQRPQVEAAVGARIESRIRQGGLWLLRVRSGERP